MSKLLISDYPEYRKGFTHLINNELYISVMGEIGMTLKRIIGILLIATMVIVQTPEFALAAESNIGVAQVSCGLEYTGILKKDGSLWMTGSNSCGQLGTGTNEAVNTPVKVMEDVAQVSCGSLHTGILKKDGSLWMTGSNNYGQLGIGTNNDYVNTPEKVMEDVAQVSCGCEDTGILKKDGSLWMTGDNTFGQLGTGTNEAVNTPVKVLENVAQVSCFGRHTGILKKDGSLWMTGTNSCGELGIREVTMQNTPVKLMEDVAEVSCGDCYTGIIKKDGSLWMAGNGCPTVFGDITLKPDNRPEIIMEDVAQVGIEGYYYGIVKKDGSLWLRGDDYYYAFDVSSDYDTPVKVMENVAQVCYGSGYTAILKKDGSLWMTGFNSCGQLGTGTNEDVRTPVMIIAGDSGNDEPEIDPVRRYVIGEDTWNFQNFTLSKPADAAAYQKFFTKVLSAHLVKTARIGKGGLCYGMSVLIPSIVDNSFPENLAGKGSIHSFEQNAEVTQWLKYGHISQLLPECQLEQAKNINDYNGLYRAVKDEMNGSGGAVLFSKPDPDHTMLVTGLVLDTPSEAIIELYDSRLPDNKNEDGIVLCSTVRLYGDNYNYTSCEYGISPTPTAEFYQTQDLAYFTFNRGVNIFKNAYLSKDKANFGEYENAKNKYKLCTIAEKEPKAVINAPNYYPIHVYYGEDDNDSDNNKMFWIDTSDNQEIDIAGLESGSTVSIASPNNSIEITPSEKTDIKVTITDEKSTAAFNLGDGGSAEITCNSGSDSITEVTSIVNGSNDISFQMEDGAVTINGVSNLEISAKTGDIDENGDVTGDAKTRVINNIDSSKDFKIGVDAILDTEPNRDANAKSDTPITTIKGKTYTCGGQKYVVMGLPTTKALGNVAFKNARNAAKVTVPATIKLADGKFYKVTQINANAFKGKKIKTVTIGKNVKVIKKNAFKGSKATKLIVKSKKLTKKSIKGSLKGSKIKTVKVKVGKRSDNKKFVKKYKKYFTKKNAGRKVKIK